MPDITIISDTSCLIVLQKIGELDLLHKMYGIIITTEEVAAEYGEELPYWIEVKSVQNKQTQKLLSLQIDDGESSAIALGLETDNCTLVIDDLKARRIAQKLNLKYTGTIGIIIKAKLNGIIPSILPLLVKMKATNFRISSEMEAIALKEANEIPNQNAND